MLDGKAADQRHDNGLATQLRDVKGLFVGQGKPPIDGRQSGVLSAGLGASGGPVLLTIPEAARILRIGRSMAYELAKRYQATGGLEGIPCVRIGQRVVRVPAEALLAMLDVARYPGV